MLEIEALAFQRNQITVLRDVRLTLAAGEVVLVRGENGSGKSTLIRLLAGLLPQQDPYRVRLDGEDYDPRDPRVQSGFLFLGHQLGIKSELTCEENLQFQSRFLGTRSGAGPLSVLRSVGLDGYQYTLAGRLSAGQRKRLALARLLLCPARLWFLDEPYSNLDSEGIALVDRLLQRHIDEAGAALMTSHGTFVPQVTRHREIDIAEWTS